MSADRVIPLERLDGRVWATVGAHGHEIVLSIPLPNSPAAVTLLFPVSDALALANALRDVAGGTATTKETA